MNCFLKFGKKEHLESLIENGEIFMNSFKFFKDLENPGKGDLYEGATLIRNIKNGFVELKSSQGPLRFNNAKIHYYEHFENHIGHMYCLYHISKKLFKRKSVHFFDKRLVDLGDSCVLIKDANRFLTKAIGKLKGYQFEIDHSTVTYKNFKHHRELKIGPFIKSHKYSYQHEYRIIAFTENEEPLKFQIGNLKDFCEIYPTKKLIKEMNISIHNK